MADQMYLFAGDLGRIPAAKATDPATSFKAIDEFTESGGRATQLDMVVELVYRYPKLTSAELALAAIEDGMPLDRSQIARRLPEARRPEGGKRLDYGPARRCSVTGFESNTWVRADDLLAVGNTAARLEDDS